MHDSTWKTLPTWIECFIFDIYFFSLAGVLYALLLYVNRERKKTQRTHGHKRKYKQQKIRAGTYVYNNITRITTWIIIINGKHTVRCGLTNSVSYCVFFSQLANSVDVHVHGDIIYSVVCSDNWNYLALSIHEY